eukprot:c19362_g1_i4.p1 GENE.c19362_g1_i4~~c19362_g1_i4.p1  ORF type:complete len:453 (+),score=88.38 c19362_g1_i4:177-1361(+)
MGFVLQGFDGQDTKTLFVMEHKLAIVFDCTFDLYAAASQNLSQLTPALSQLGSLSPEMRKSVISRINYATRALTLLNGDHYTAWNIRKKLLALRHVTLKHELALIDLVFTKHPKSSETWAHRLYILEHSVLTPDVIQHEFGVCSEAAQRHPKNYYAWTHRTRMAKLADPETLVGEVTAMEGWSRTHVSDHAGHHHKQALFRHVCALIAESSESESTKALLLAMHRVGYVPILDRPGVVICRHLVIREFDTNASLVLRYPGHETLWAHRRFLWSLHTQHRNQWSKFGAPTNESETDTETTLCEEENRAGDVYHVAAHLYASVNSSEPNWEHEWNLCASCFEGSHETQRHFAAAYALWLIQEGEGRGDLDRRAAAVSIVREGFAPGLAKCPLLENF